MPASLLGSGTVYLCPCPSASCVQLQSVTTLGRHENSPVDSAQNHERLTGAEIVETGVPVKSGRDVSWKYHVGALRAMCLNCLVCRCCCADLRERHGKDAERHAQEPSLPRRSCFTLTAGDARHFDHDLHLQ